MSLLKSDISYYHSHPVNILLSACHSLMLLGFPVESYSFRTMWTHNEATVRKYPLFWRWRSRNAHW